ncbi:MAG: DUF2273 domain-containing protein [Clostridia bacterium]|jgi:uncharacterized membrane protein|nr:DUF2273 domain-containing protein [Clostridia bacterium]
MKEFCQNHKWAIILSALALIIVLMIYLTNFWWTLLAGVLVLIAVFFGRMIDKGGVEAVKDFFRSIFKGKRA